MKRWWQSNVFQVILLFEFVPASVLYALGSISTGDGQALMATLTTGVALFLARDLGTKGVDAWADKE